MLRGMDQWTFGGADASIASTWFGLRHARLRVVVLQRTVVSSLGCSVSEFWMLRFRDLGTSCFGLRFRVLRFRNYPLRAQEMTSKCDTNNSKDKTDSLS